jgi:hypothetical protein
LHVSLFRAWKTLNWSKFKHAPPPSHPPRGGDLIFSKKSSDLGFSDVAEHGVRQRVFLKKDMPSKSSTQKYFSKKKNEKKNLLNLKKKF